MDQTLPLRLDAPPTVREETLRIPTDEALVANLVGPEGEDAFRVLYRRHITRLHRIAIRMAHSPADAEDAIQETWLRALRQLDAFEGRSSLATWLTGILINVIRDDLSRRGRWQTVELDDELTGEIPAVSNGDIERAIALLPAGARAAFVLHDIEGFTHEEIAAQLGWVAGTSKTQLHRARRALRSALSDYLEESRS